MIQKILSKFRQSSPRFGLFRDHENDFVRIAAGQAFAALFIAPLYSYIMFRSEAPMMYVYAGIIYTLSYPVICFLVYFIKGLRQLLVYVFIFEFFVLTAFAYVDLRANGFEVNELVFFFVFYIITSLYIQRLYPAVLYQLSVLLALLADNTLLEASEVPPFFIVGLFLIVGLTACTAVYLRMRLILSISDHVKYLKRIMNNPGSGYILFKPDKFVIEDYNEEVSRIFNVAENKLQEALNTLFSEKEYQEVLNIKQGQTFKKQISLARFNSRNYIEVKVNLLSINNESLLLAVVTDRKSVV